MTKTTILAFVQYTEQGIKTTLHILAQDVVNNTSSFITKQKVFEYYCMLNLKESTITYAPILDIRKNGAYITD